MLNRDIRINRIKNRFTLIAKDRKSLSVFGTLYHVNQLDFVSDFELDIIDNFIDSASFVQRISRKAKSVNVRVSELEDQKLATLIQEVTEEKETVQAILSQPVNNNVISITKKYTINSRVDQYDFRKRVAANFSHKCAITGEYDLCEAAHIDAFSDSKDQSTNNGVYMNILFHKMFDNNLMTINPNDLTVVFSKNVTHKYALMFAGHKIAAGKMMININGLRKHYDAFMQRENGYKTISQGTEK